MKTTPHTPVPTTRSGSRPARTSAPPPDEAAQGDTGLPGHGPAAGHHLRGDLMTDHPSMQVWTPHAVRQLGMTTDLPTAASILGIGRTPAFDLAKTGDFPVRLLRLGRRVLVPVADLLAILGDPPSPYPAPPGSLTDRGDEGDPVLS